jgi:hypothetical protein
MTLHTSNHNPTIIPPLGRCSSFILIMDTFDNGAQLHLLIFKYLFMVKEKISVKKRRERNE